MATKQKIGIIGLGSQSMKDHIPAILRKDDLRIVAVCDSSAAARENFETEYRSMAGTAKVFSEYQEMIEKSDLDYAVVAVPHDAYSDIIPRLVKSGIYFMKEKPLARNLEEAISLESIEKYKKFGFICTQRRYDTLYQEAQNGITKIGDPYLINLVYTLAISNPAEGWRGERMRAGGGCLLDMGYHVVDQLIWWFGLPERVFASTSVLAVPDIEYDAEDSATVAYMYKNGLHGTAIISRSAGTKRDFYELYGTKGSMVGDRSKLLIYDRDGNVVMEKRVSDQDKCIDKQLEFFLDSAKKGRGFEKNHSENLLDMKFINMCYRSTEESPGVIV